MKAQKDLVRTSPIKKIGNYTWQEYLRQVKYFHGYAAPGVIIGGIMVSLAMEQIPRDTLFNVICETIYCLPDSVPLLTPCTIGNGRLKIINLGRFALSLNIKGERNGIRIYLDVNKLDNWDEIKAWFLKLKDKSEQDVNKLRDQIGTAGRDIYTIHPVQIKLQYAAKYSKGAIGICKVCGEAYPLKDGTICLGCQGGSPYEDKNK